MRSHIPSPAIAPTICCAVTGSATCASTRPANARAKSLAEKPMFCDLLTYHRCIVPASGFYEWKKEGTRNLRFYFHRDDGTLLLFAGQYNCWQAARRRPRKKNNLLT